MNSKSINCAYCGQSKCRCTYRAGRMGKMSMTMHNTSQQTTLGEMRKALAEIFTSPNDTSGAWLISFTKFDLEKIAKAEAKRLSEPPNRKGK